MKLNVCCGKDYREGYVNTDFSNLASDGSEIKVDVVWNVLESPPEELREADEIIFHESLEHFNRHNGIQVLFTLWSALKEGGVLDLTVPNSVKQMKILLQMMMNPSPVSFQDFEDAHKRFTYWKWHDDLMGGTRESDGFDGDSHKTLYTQQSLLPLLRHTGFKIESVVVDDSIRILARK